MALKTLRMSRGTVPSARTTPVTLGLVFAAYVLAFADRQIIGLFVEPLKRDLGLSDTQYGLLSGLTFALVLGTAGLPLGRYVDVARRVRAAGAGLAFSGALTLLAGLSTTFPGLLACRAGVALGQAALTPAGHSIVADAVPAQRLGFAFGLYGMGPHIGLGLAYLVGAGVAVGLPALQAMGLPGLSGLHAWQVAFFVIAVPALLLAAWMARRPEPARSTLTAAVAPPLREVAQFLRRNLTAFFGVKFTAAFTAMATYAVAAWAPAYMIRTFGWSPAAAGATLGPVLMVCGLIGVAAGGGASDWAARRGPGSRLLVMGTAALIAVPVALATTLSDDARLAVTGLGALSLLGAMVASVSPAATAVMTPGRMRGVASALGVLVVNVAGLGVGPVAVALITDNILHDPTRLSVALAISLPAMLLASTACAFGSAAAYGRACRAAGV